MPAMLARALRISRNVFIGIAPFEKRAPPARGLRWRMELYSNVVCYIRAGRNMKTLPDFYARQG